MLQALQSHTYRDQGAPALQPEQAHIALTGGGSNKPTSTPPQMMVDVLGGSRPPLSCSVKNRM